MIKLVFLDWSRIESNCCREVMECTVFILGAWEGSGASVRLGRLEVGVKNRRVMVRMLLLRSSRIY